jgi:hypothetical protein
MTKIARRVTFRLPDGLSSSALLRYDAADPYKVVLDFGAHPQDGEPMTWTFARDLLADGLTRRAGEGDVRCWTCSHGYHIVLSSPDGRATIRFSADAVRAFLVDTEDLVPYGAETVDFDVELSKLLIGGS